MITRRVHQTMNNPQPRVHPSSTNRVCIIYPQERQGQCNGVERRRLLMQMVEVLGLPAHLGRKSSGQKMRRNFWPGRKTGFFNVSEARHLQPAAHDEGPEVEADDGAEEGGRRQTELGGRSHDRKTAS